MTALGVVCLLTAHDEAPILTELTRRGADLDVRRRCLDAAELLGVAQAGIGDVAVLTAGAPDVDAPLVAKLREARLPVVIAQGPGAQALADSVAELDGPIEVADLTRLVAAVRDAHARPVLPLAPLTPTTNTAGPDEPAGPGRLIAVWGPRGAPGRTTLAISLAAELAARDLAVLLADADPTGGDVAALLGLLDEAPGMLAAARACDGELTDRRLARLAPLAAGMRILTGIDGPERAAELAGAPLVSVWRAASRLADYTVIDCGTPGCLHGWRLRTAEQEERGPLGHNPLDRADTLVIVGRGDPLGIKELIRFVTALPAGSRPGGLHVVVNRVRTGAVGGRPGPTIRQALRRFAGVRRVSLLPEATETLDAAVLNGKTLRESDPRGPLTRAIELLADEIMAPGPLADAEVAEPT